MDHEQNTDGKERIAKRISRAGAASRREAERMIEAGRVRLNGQRLDSAATLVDAQDRIEIDGVPLAAPEPPRVWRYHKPSGRVTTTRDEEGRPTIFEALPEDMPRVMSVGRLDLTSEGLLLLTNDGGLKRVLELPSTGWLRRYRVRIKGNPDPTDLDPLRRGIEVEGIRYAPMEVQIDRMQGANAWLTIGLREGKNREIRKVLGALGFDVNRLLRVSYGPFQLGDLERGAVEEVRRSVLRDQIGGLYEEIGPPREKSARQRRKPGMPKGASKGAPKGAMDLSARFSPKGTKKGAVGKSPGKGGAPRPARGPRR